MAKLNWTKISKFEYDADVSTNFFVEIINGTELLKEVKDKKYKEDHWYGYLWSFNKLKFRLCRRRICERRSLESCKSTVENYIFTEEVQQELQIREEYYVADRVAIKNAAAMAQLLGIVPKKKKKKLLPEISSK